MTCIETGRRQTPLGLVVDHFALAEGLTETEIDSLRSTWSKLYGVPAALAGAAWALRLPLPVAKVTTPGIAELHAVPLPEATPTGHVLQGGWCDLWISCPDQDAATKMARQLESHLPPGLGAKVSVGNPEVADLESWAALRLASEVGAL